MERLSTLFDFVLTSIVLEVFALPFLLGLVLFVVGLALIVLFVLSRTLGYRITGKVVGAVERKRIKKKDRDGETIEKIKKMLYPVYEYTASTGEVRQMLSSEGGTSTLDYVTGQSVSLIVREDEGYDDVYDASNRGALYFGLVLAGIGLGFMSFIGNFAAAFGVGASLLVLTALALTVRAMLDKFGSSAEIKPASSKSTEAERKTFSPSDVYPIEHFKI